MYGPCPPTKISSHFFESLTRVVSRLDCMMWSSTWNLWLDRELRELYMTKMVLFIFYFLNNYLCFLFSCLILFTWTGNYLSPHLLIDHLTTLCLCIHICIWMTGILLWIL